jgi:Putative esterase
VKEVSGPPGPPWDRELAGRLDALVVESDVLAGNPLGDPSRRPLYVYVPPGAGDGPLPSVYLIQGMTGQVDMWRNREAFAPTMFERVDDLFTGGCSPAIVVFVDAWTFFGGSQFINSDGTGRYMDYLCDEIVPFVDERYPTARDRDRRALTGKSSGGYGAMVVPMLRPEVFGALASHSGDALFEACYLPEFPLTTRTLRDEFEGSYEVFFERLRAAERLESSWHAPLNTYAMAACYSPDPAQPGKALLPFEIETGRLIDEIWGRWLDWDPVRMAARHRDALETMRCIYLEAGRSDEFYLDLGAQAFARELEEGGISFDLVLFEGAHGHLQYRYPGAIRTLVEAMT